MNSEERNVLNNVFEHCEDYKHNRNDFEVRNRHYSSYYGLTDIKKATTPSQSVGCFFK